MQANPAMQLDVKTLTLSPNLAPQSSEPSSSDTERPQFVCPLTLKEMNGAQPFVYCASFPRQGWGPPTPKDRKNDKGKAKAATTDPSDAKFNSALDVGRSTPKPRTSSCSTLLKTRKTPCMKQRSVSTFLNL